MEWRCTKSETGVTTGITLMPSALRYTFNMKMKIVYSVWQQCMLDSHNYNKIQTQIRQ